MIEDIIIRQLTDAKLRAYAEEPRDAVAFPYYVVTRTGGSDDEHLRRATIAVQSYGGSLLEAATANKTVIPLIFGMTSLDAVSSVYLNSDYNFTDTRTKRYRFQAVFEITYYEEA